jgi:hypothetical protein
VSTGPCARERGRADGVGRLTGGGGGANRSRSGRTHPRRGSTTVLRDRGGGLAWLELVDHGGGANLAGGSLGRPVHGEVAGFRGGEVAGEATGHDRGKRMVRCVRGEVCEPLQFDSKLLERGGRAHRSEGRRRR